MREFLKGWRRKAGCVTLVVALGLMTVWMRSHYFVDQGYVTGDLCRLRNVCASGLFCAKPPDPLETANETATQLGQYQMRQQTIHQRRFHLDAR